MKYLLIGLILVFIILYMFFGNKETKTKYIKKNKHDSISLLAQPGTKGVTITIN